MSESLAGTGVERISFPRFASLVAAFEGQTSSNRKPNLRVGTYLFAYTIFFVKGRTEVELAAYEPDWHGHPQRLAAYRYARGVAAHIAP